MVLPIDKFIPNMGAKPSFKAKDKILAHSTEYTSNNAWNQNFNATNGNLNYNTKATNTNQVRPVSAHQGWILETTAVW